MKNHSFRSSIGLTPVLISICFSIICLASITSGARAIRNPSSGSKPGLMEDLAPDLAPIDPQQWQDQQDMTWADYHPNPGVDWADPSLVPARKLRVALVAVDFPDQPFVITLPKNSDLFGNPQIDPISRADVPQFYAYFYNTPGPINHGHKINGYWMEQSRGKIGIPKIDAFGPYRMPKNLFQYGLNEWNQRSECPSGFRN